MSIKKRYEEIKEKYNLSVITPELSYVEEYANCWYMYTSDVKEKKIALYGGGANAKAALKLLTLWGEVEKVDYIIDNGKKGTYKNIPIICENEIDDKDIGLVWITVFSGRDEIVNSLQTNHASVICVDPYEWIENRLHIGRGTDIRRNAEFYRYKWFINKLIERKVINDRDEIQALSKELIAGYYCICDWVSLKSEIDDYIEQGYSDGDVYLDLWNETEKYLKSIQDILRSRKTNDCILFLLDSLSKFDAGKMPHLSNWKKGALEFTQYRTEYPFTREVMMSMFTGWRPFENKTYNNKAIKYTDSLLLEDIRKKDIKIKYITEYHRILGSFKNINSYMNKYEENTVISEVLFNAICELVDDPNPQIVVAHTLSTIHWPHLTPVTMFIDYENVRNPKSAYKRYYEEALNYTDVIVRYYTEFLDKCDNITQIVMGDHGIDVEAEYYYNIKHEPDPRCATMWNMDIISPELLVKGKKVIPGTEKRIISSNQLVDILHAIINDKEPREYITFKNVLPLEIVPGYSKDWLTAVISSQNYYLAVAGSGCMNEGYMYLNLESGKELFYKIDERKLIQAETAEDKCEVIESIGENEIKNSRFNKKVLQDSFFEDHNKIFSSILNLLV